LIFDGSKLMTLIYNTNLEKIKVNNGSIVKMIAADERRRNQGNQDGALKIHHKQKRG